MIIEKDLFKINWLKRNAETDEDARACHKSTSLGDGGGDRPFLAIGTAAMDQRYHIIYYNIIFVLHRVQVEKRVRTRILIRIQI